MSTHLAFSEGNRVNERLALLDAFRIDVWENDHIFRERRTCQSSSNIRTAEYLNWGKHLRAAQFICTTMQDALLLVVQEYCHAMDMFKSRDSGYQEGTCILGQHGIATMLSYDLA